MRTLACALAFALLWATPAPAQDETPPPPETQEPAKPDAEEGQPPHASPRAAVRGFLQAARASDFERAAQFLDTSRVPQAKPPRIARHLKFVLDQKLWLDLETISAQRTGDLQDGLARQDEIGTIDAQAGSVPIRVERGPDDRWRFAPGTVARVDDLYDEYGLGPLGEILPLWMFQRVGELDLWQWIGLIGVVVLAYLLSTLLAATLARITLRLATRTKHDFDDELVDSAKGPVTAIVFIAIFMLASVPLGLAVPVRATLANFASAGLILALAWLAVRMIDVAASAMERALRQKGETTALTVIPVGRRVSKVFLMLIAILAMAQNLGFNVLSIIAGLGVVGIGVALAAQKTFENFFGALAILVDQPVRRGDFCRFGDKVGTVEDIGLRSTRVRTLERTLVTVPNADFSSLQLENFGARDRMLFRTTLGLRYETSADQLRHVLVGLRRLLVRHARVDPDPLRVRFVSFGAFSLDVEIYCYINTADFNEFLAIREDLMLEIIDVVEASGTGFAFPSQTLYLGKDDGLDGELTKAAESQVKTWLEQNELPLPDDAADELAKLRNTRPYPPEGSALRRSG